MESGNLACPGRSSAQDVIAFRAITPLKSGMAWRLYRKAISALSQKRGLTLRLTRLDSLITALLM